MRVGAKSIAGWLLPLAVLLGTAGALVGDFGHIASRVAGVQFDAYQRIQPRPYEDTTSHGGFTVRVLDADSASIARFGAWPWPSPLIAKLAGELKAEGAALVVLALPPEETGTAAQRSSSDDALVAALVQMKSVTGFMLDESENRPPAITGRIAFSGADVAMAAVPQFSGGSTVPAKTASASAGLGALNLLPDSDGKIRSVPMVLRVGTELVPSLDAETGRLAGKQPALAVRTEESGLPGVQVTQAIAGASAGDFDIPLRPDGAMEVYFSSSDPERNISAAALDEHTIAPTAFKNAIVVIGPPGSEVATPLGLRSVADVHAEAIENMLLGTALRPASSPLAGVVFLLVAGFVLVMLFARANVIWTGAFTAAAVLAAQGFSWFLFSRSHVLLDAAGPNAALAFVYVTGLLARTVDVARTRAELKGSFSDLLPVNTIEEIAHAPERLKLGGEVRVVTCLSCGIRGYAALARSFTEDPAGFTRLINLAMAPLIDEAVNHGGMIGAFDGEKFTAYWNAPLEDSQHTMHACEAATRMTMTLAQVNEQLSHERRVDGTPFPPLEVGIGIATGPAITGGLTSRGRTNYSVTGECTVLADRIREISGQYGPAVVVSESTREAASRGYAFLEVDFIALAPGDTPVKLYAMLGNPLVRASPKFRALATFHEHIFQSLRSQQWDKTRELIEQCRKLSGASQKMYDLHLARVAWFQTHTPGPEWDGAFRPVVT